MVPIKALDFTFVSMASDEAARSEELRWDDRMLVRAFDSAVQRYQVCSCPFLLFIVPARRLPRQPLGQQHTGTKRLSSNRSRLLFLLI